MTFVKDYKKKKNSKLHKHNSQRVCFNTVFRGAFHRTNHDLYRYLYTAMRSLTNSLL